MVIWKGKIMFADSCGEREARSCGLIAGIVLKDILMMAWPAVGVSV